MAERVIQPLAEANTAPPTAEEIAAGLEQAQTHFREVAPHLGRLLGMDLDVQPGNAWATIHREGKPPLVTADVRFFIDKGYTPDMANYATIHEPAAHGREMVTEPELTKRVFEFRKQGEPQATFHNIFADIAGNNLTHAVLPRMKDVGAQLYGEKLFPETDETPLPRHLQFLYKIIRQEMVPDSETAVLPEVDEAIAELRDYQGQGDLIKYSTAVAKSAREAMGAEERFGMWTRMIYPVYERLLEQDRQDPSRQDQSEGSTGDTPEENENQPASQGNPDPQQEQGDGQGESKSDEQSQGSPSDNDQKSDSESQGNTEPQQSEGQTDKQSGGQPDGSPSSNDQRSDSERFGSYYQDYAENRHPEPMNEAEHDKLHQHAKERARANKHSQSPAAVQREHERMLDEKLQAETGHSLNEQRQYDAKITEWQSAIQEMRDVFQGVINERVAQKRGLSRRTFAEGAVLDPDRLVQTVIDVRNNVEEPEAFKDYEMRKGETQALGKTDYVFMFDVSGSMHGENAVNAATAAVIGLEGLAALQRDVKATEAVHNLDLELDIRTAIYTFGDVATCVKPLSSRVTPKERLDTYAAVANPGSRSTRDFLALEEIASLPNESDRRKILIAVSDGGSNDGHQDTSDRARQAIDKLRAQGWLVYGISIGSDEAEHLYRPTARRVDDPNELPEAIHNFIEATIS